MMTGKTSQTGTARPRRVFMVLSPRSLGYAKYALESLFRNVLEPIHLHLITDSNSDKDLLLDEMTKNQQTGEHTWSVFAKQELDNLADTVFDRYPNLRQFRNGHPCWRKISDPVLLSQAGEEMILLDPDIYFPNRFCFESTPDRGLLLMWQQPICLLPPEMVQRAFDAQIALAHHVDIGVAHWRAPVDLDWLEWLILKLGANQPEVKHIPHVEAIVWAALAMRLGGGYLPADLWHCYHRTQGRRLLHKLGIAGYQILRFERFSKMKCFHAGGEAKMWVPGAIQHGWAGRARTLNLPGPTLPFVELTYGLYDRQQRLKRLLRKTGYYRIFQSEWAPTSGTGV
jgi:hypothetical protein